MTQDGPATMEGLVAVGTVLAQQGDQSVYVMCRQCVKRYRVVADGPPLEAMRCECGARLREYCEPVELSAPPRGVVPRLTRFWRAGREDGYWNEKRFFRPAAAERVGATPRQVRFAYEAGRRAGARLREGAHAHAMRVLRMKGMRAAGAAGAAGATGAGMRTAAA